jgi:hypothetical protein
MMATPILSYRRALGVWASGLIVWTIVVGLIIDLGWRYHLEIALGLACAHFFVVWGTMKRYEITPNSICWPNSKIQTSQDKFSGGSISWLDLATIVGVPFLGPIAWRRERRRIGNAKSLSEKSK